MRAGIRTSRARPSAGRQRPGRAWPPAARRMPTAGRTRGRAGSIARLRSSSDSEFGRTAQHGQYFVAGAHGVIVGLAGRTFLVAVLAIAAIEDPVPGAMLVIDEVLPRMAPHAIVGFAIGRIA